jgi:hypothetical protein
MKALNSTFRALACQLRLAAQKAFQASLSAFGLLMRQMAKGI